jgi:hypothetical protein
MRQDTLVKLKETFNWVHERSRELRRVDMKMAKEFAHETGYMGQVLNPYLRDLELEDLEERVLKVEEIAQVATRIRPRRTRLKD